MELSSNLLLLTASQVANTVAFGWKETLTLIGIAATLIVGIWNLVNNTKNNTKALYVNAITSERVRWIGDLKELLAEYLSMITIYEDKPVLEGEKQAIYFERLIYLQNKLKLHLNYKDDKDKEINVLVDRINEKIFGLYDVNKLLQLSREERISTLKDLKYRKCFDKVIEKKFDLEGSKRYFVNQDKGVLSEIINEVIQEINKDLKDKFGYKGQDELHLLISELVDKSRIYLKEEWEKVKKEAENGKLK